MRRIALPIVVCLAVASAIAADQSDGTAPPTIRIASPGNGAYVSGPTLLQLIANPERAVASVAFSVDGRQVCIVRRPPFQCDWDAGGVVVQHDVRAAVTLTSGGRLFATVRTKGTGYTESVDVNVIQVTVAVTQDGKFVHGLPRDVFHVSEDDKPQTITGFSDSASALDLIVAVDVSGSMGEAMPKLKAAVSEFLGAVPGKDRVTLLAFNDRIFTLLQQATDPDQRAAAVDGLAAGGETALYDVIVTAVDRLGRRQGRKAIVVFSDGEDRGSHVTLDMVERKLEESDATLFMIGQGRGTKIAELKKIMLRLANPTGGRAVFAEDVDDLKPIFKDLLEELSNQYLLGYPPTNDKQDGTWRKIKVRVDGPYQLRARQGYRARGGN
jgi:VWFA-related protein